jgi:hypothetical protein
MQSQKIALSLLHGPRNYKHIHYIEDAGIAMLFECVHIAPAGYSSEHEFLFFLFGSWIIGAPPLWPGIGA